MSLLTVVRNYLAQTIYVDGKNDLKLANTFGKLKKRPKKAIAEQKYIKLKQRLHDNLTQK